MVESDRTVRVGLDQRDLVSTYMLCPSPLSVPNFKLERAEVSEWVRVLDMNVIDWSEGWRVRDEVEIARFRGNLI